MVKYFRPLESPMNKNVTFLFIVKNISCVQFSSCHTSDENFLTSNFSQTMVHTCTHTCMHTHKCHQMCSSIAILKSGITVDYSVVNFSHGYSSSVNTLMRNLAGSYLGNYDIKCII